MLDKKPERGDRNRLNYVASMLDKIESVAVDSKCVMSARYGPQRAQIEWDFVGCILNVRKNQWFRITVTYLKYPTIRVDTNLFG